MHPKVIVTVDGKPVAGAFYERLVSLVITDRDGKRSDSVAIELADGPPDYLALPRRGAVIRVQLGYVETRVRDMGAFVVDEVSGNCLPYALRITGRAADLRDGKLKERKERHWDRKSLSDIVKQLADENGLTPVITGSIGSHVYDWLGQQDESDMHFLERLAGRHNALFTVKDGRLVFSAKGTGTSASGAALAIVTIAPQRMITGSCRFQFADRGKFKKVVAYYQDRDKAKRTEVGVDADPKGEATFRIPEPFASIAEADKAAEAKARELMRGGLSASVTVPGDTSIRAGAPLVFEGVRPGLDGEKLVIETATHRFSKPQGYLTEIAAKSRK
ncbi:contractile injection system protein, VgrG/Pvc8 family [Breoghania sp. L-A4]|uniref:phage late control D family protein n=1 Tax=Breoghania sp. L-A4 TaxID=2304600 RepID=UPI000E35B5D7|nr:contractile injection system protein, VgrG/Pvc8 family [Breoghania sp. L-A4]AXS39282.1 late control protein D [Breoghania sp. L-A4]